MAKNKKKFTQEEEKEIYADILENSTPKKNILDQIKINVKCKSENQKKLIKSIQNKDITICSGPAGTGKTYISCAEALLILKKDPKIKKIIIVKSVTTLKEEEVGFLKGTLKEKLEPVMYSFSGNFEKLLGNVNGKYYTRGGYLMGVCLEYLEQPETALKFYHQIVESGLKDEWVENSQKRISLLTED